MKRQEYWSDPERPRQARHADGPEPARELLVRAGAMASLEALELPALAENQLTGSIPLKNERLAYLQKLNSE
jgi:hypothetical protein